jgi:hypothetical protein
MLRWSQEHGIECRFEARRKLYFPILHLPALASFITPCTAKPIRFGIQRRVQGLFSRSPHHRAEMIPDTGFIWITWPIAFNPSSSLIASILPQFRGSWHPESAKDSVRYHGDRGDEGQET